MRYCLLDPERAEVEGMNSEQMEELFLKLR